jgi:hypothetical protein
MDVTYKVSETEYKDLRLVRIRWEGAHHHFGWMTLEEARSQNSAVNNSVGWVLEESAYSITLIFSHDLDECDGVLVIPRSAIKEEVELSIPETIKEKKPDLRMPQWFNHEFEKALESDSGAQRLWIMLMDRLAEKMAVELSEQQ